MIKIDSWLNRITDEPLNRKFIVVMCYSVFAIIIKLGVRVVIIWFAIILALFGILLFKLMSLWTA